MANTKNAAVGEATAANEATITEPVYRLDVLQKNCLKLFGVSQTTFAGATAGIEDREYSINELKGIISEWREKEVK